MSRHLKRLFEMGIKLQDEVAAKEGNVYVVTQAYYKELGADVRFLGAMLRDAMGRRWLYGIITRWRSSKRKSRR